MISSELVWLRVVDLQVKQQSRWNQEVLKRMKEKAASAELRKILRR